jgi:WD40 repeat protein
MPYSWVGYDILSECRSIYTVNISTAEISQLPRLIWEIWEQTPDLTKALVRTGSNDWSVINIDGGVQEGFELPEEATVCKWSPDGSIIACGMLTDSVWNEEESKFTHMYKLWTVDAVNGETITVVDEIEDLLGSLAWSPEGDILACGVGKNRQLGIVDVATGEKIEGEIEGVRDILWSPDGKHIAYTNWKEIFIVSGSLSHGFCVYPKLEPAENEETLSWISLKAWLR